MKPQRQIDWHGVTLVGAILVIVLWLFVMAMMGGCANPHEIEEGLYWDSVSIGGLYGEGQTIGSGSTQTTGSLSGASQHFQSNGWPGGSSASQSSLSRSSTSRSMSDSEGWAVFGWLTFKVKHKERKGHRHE